MMPENVRLAMERLITSAHKLVAGELEVPLILRLFAYGVTSNDVDEYAGIARQIADRGMTVEQATAFRKATDTPEERAFIGQILNAIPPDKADDRLLLDWAWAEMNRVLGASPGPGPSPPPGPPPPGPGTPYTSRLSYGMVNFLPLLSDDEMQKYISAAQAAKIRVRVEWMGGKGLNKTVEEIRQRMARFLGYAKEQRVPVDIGGIENGNAESRKNWTLAQYKVIGQHVLDLCDPTKDRVLPVNEPDTKAQFDFHNWFADKWTAMGGKIIGYGKATHKESIHEFHPQKTSDIRKGQRHESDNHPILAALGSDGEDQNFDLAKSKPWAVAVMGADAKNEAGFYGWHHRKPDYPLMAMLRDLPANSGGDEPLVDALGSADWRKGDGKNAVVENRLRNARYTKDGIAWDVDLSGWKDRSGKPPKGGRIMGQACYFEDRPGRAVGGMYDGFRPSDKSKHTHNITGNGRYLGDVQTKTGQTGGLLCLVHHSGEKRTNAVRIEGVFGRTT